MISWLYLKKVAHVTHSYRTNNPVVPKLLIKLEFENSGFHSKNKLNKSCTHEETGIFFLGVPPAGGFLFDLSEELDPVTDRPRENS